MGLLRTSHASFRALSLLIAFVVLAATATPLLAAPTPAPPSRAQGAPTDQIHTLIQTIDAAVANGGIDSATLGAQLKAHLQAAADAVASGKKIAAAVALTAFIKDMNAQAKHINPATAGNLAEGAEGIKNTLLGTPPFHAPSAASVGISAIRPADVSATVVNDCSSPASLASVKAGDTVDIDIYMSTDDPDEVGEGEGLVVSVPGVPNATFLSYGGFSNYQATAKSAGTVTACIALPGGELW